MGRGLEMPTDQALKPLHIGMAIKPIPKKKNQQKKKKNMSMRRHN